MKLVKQNNKTTCGQACIAMIKNISLAESIQLFGHDKTTTEEEILEILGYGTIEVGQPKTIRIAICKHQEPNGIRSHWTVWNHGKILDPANIKNLWPIIKYIEIVL